MKFVSHLLKMLLFVFFCTQVSAEKPSEIRKKNQTLNVGMFSVPDNLDPVKVWHINDSIIMQKVYRPLVALTNEGFFQGDLADSWEISEDEKTYTFYLDPEARFEDGSPILASDVAWSISRHFWRDSDSTYESLLSGALEGADVVQKGERVSGIEVVDPHTIKFKFKKFYPAFFDFLESSEFGALPKNCFDPKHPLSSGSVHAEYDSEKKSWTLSDTSKGSKEGKSQVKTVHVLPLQDIQGAAKRLASGELDVIMGLQTAEIDQLNLSEDFEVKKIQNTSYVHLFYNMERPLFKSPEFRRDLSQLLQTAIKNDRDPHGLRKRTQTYLTEGVLPSSYYERTLVKMKPEKFKTKWPHVPRLKILSNGLLEQNIVDVLTVVFHQAGITPIWVEVSSKEYQKGLRARNYDLLLGGFIGFAWDPEMLLPPLQPKNPMGYCNGDNVEFFKKIQKARTISEHSLRLEAYSEAFKFFEGQDYFIPLFQENMFLIAPKAMTLVGNHAKNYENFVLWGLFWN